MRTIDTDDSGNVHILGSIRAAGFTLASGGTPLLASALGHPHAKVISFSGIQSDDTRVIHVVKGATGTIVSFSAGAITACVGDASVDVDLYLNGVSVLSAAITLDNTDSDYDVTEGTLSTTAVTSDDVLSVVVTIDNGTYPAGVARGLFAELRVNEDADAS